MIAVASTGQLLLLLAEQYLGPRPRSGAGEQLVMISAIAIAMTVCVPIARRFLDQRPLVSLGLRFDRLALKDLLFGWILGGVMVGSFFLVLLLTDSLVVSEYAWESGAVSAPLIVNAVAAILAGWAVELFLRGYAFDNLVAALGLNGAAAVSCLGYAVYHSVVFDATLWSTIVVVAIGFLAIFGLLTTQQLWLSMGMWIGWAFFNGAVFGFEPGIADSFRLIRHTTHGTPWFTGGPFGSEGSLLVLPILAVAAGAMYFWSRRIRWNTSRG